MALETLEASFAACGVSSERSRSYISAVSGVRVARLSQAFVVFFFFFPTLETVFHSAQLTTAASIFLLRFVLDDLERFFPPRQRQGFPAAVGVRSSLIRFLVATTDPHFLIPFPSPFFHSFGESYAV